MEGNLDGYLDSFMKAYDKLKERGEDLYLDGSSDPMWVFAIKKDLVQLDDKGLVRMTQGLIDYLFEKNNIPSENYGKISSLKLKPYTKLAHYHYFGPHSFDDLENTGHAEAFSASSLEDELDAFDKDTEQYNS